MALDHLDHLERESRRFVEVLRAADPAAPVPSCPGWTADDLLWHLAEVQWFWASIVADRRQSPDGLEHPPRPGSHEALVAMLTAQSERLHDALSRTPPDEPLWMWAADRTAGYIRRRQAHEALIHRLDAELVVGEVTPLDPALAADGVHEVLDVMYGGCPPWGSFHPSDLRVDVVVEDGGPVVPVVLGRFTGADPESGTAYDEEDLSVRQADPATPAQATVMGKAEDLDAWLWHRRDDSGLTFTGNPDVLARLTAVLAQPIT